MNKILIFILGAAAGSVVTWQLVKAKYEKLAKEEIEAMERYYTEADEETEEPEEVIDIKKAASRVDVKKPSIDEYCALVNDTGYTAYSNTAKSDASEKEVEEKNEETEDEYIEEEIEKLEPKIVADDAPYVISPDEFGEFDDYEKISLTYYSDGYLTDDCNELVDDVENKVGWESLNDIGKYEPDSVHVRNDRLRTDYEILRDLRNYYPDIRSNEDSED